MTLSVSTIGNNPQQPGIWAETYIPDQLIAGNLKLVTQPIVLASGSLPRGSILGRVTTNPILATAGEDNTGNGTIGTISQGASPKFGRYTLTATGATTFTVVDPEGVSLPNATVGSAYNNAQIKFTITAGGTAFAAGDLFYLDATQAAGQYVLSVKSASDGSQTPVAILADAADATDAPVQTGAYLMGEFNDRAVNFDSSWALADLKAALASNAIYLKSSVSAADPT